MCVLLDFTSFSLLATLYKGSKPLKTDTGLLPSYMKLTRWLYLQYVQKATLMRRPPRPALGLEGPEKRSGGAKDHPLPLLSVSESLRLSLLSARLSSLPLLL